MSDRVAMHANRECAGKLAAARAFHLLLGLMLLVFAAWLLWDFPLARPWLFGVAALVVLVQWFDARAWLVAVPVTFAVIDLGAWSGRVLFSEQDALLASIVGTALVAGQYRGSGVQLVRPNFAPLLLLFLVLVMAVARGLIPAPALDVNALNGYLTGWNSIRIAKGPLWGLILWPLLARQLDDDPQATATRLSCGLAAALIGFGVFVLWERGLALDLMQAKNVWGFFDNWLDLSGSYRITGPFSQMHLGGEAVDGFLALTWPFAFLLTLQARRWPLASVALIALAMAAYGVMVTFTRTTYVSIAIALLAFGAVSLKVAGDGNRTRLVWVALYAIAAAAVFVYGFQLGGSVTILGYLVVTLVAVGSLNFTSWRAAPTMLAVGALALLVAGTSLAAYGMTHSKWTEVDAPTAIAVVAVSTLVLGIGGLALGAALRPWRGTPSAVVLLMSFAVLLPVVSLSISSYRIGERFLTVSRDFDFRLAHWRHVLALLPRDAKTMAFGVGLGRFPVINVLAADEPIGTWHFDHGESRRFVRLLGTATLCFGQRLHGLESGTYRVEVEFRNPSQRRAHLAVKIQPRRLLEAESWQPKEKVLNFEIEPTSSAWRRREVEFELSADSMLPWYDPRFVVFALSNWGDSRSALDVSYVRLIDAAGRNRLENSNFAAGGDRWFAYNDFNHLEWHAKNLYLAIYFDLGILGLAAFALIWLVALAQGWRQARRNFHFGAAAVAALVGILLLGTTGTLLDVPQLMTLLMLIAVAAMWRLHPR